MPRYGRVKRVGRVDPAKNTPSQPGLPNIYTDMLADTVSSSNHVTEEGRTIKKRRIAGRMVSQDPDEENHFQSELSNDPDQVVVDGLDAELKPARQQTAYNESEDSAESDMDWEEVDLVHPSMQEDSPERDNEPQGELNLVLGQIDHEARKPARMNRKPITKEEKQLRLEIHKIHLLSLLFHVHLRNHWCNDKEVHVTLKSLLSSRMISYLNPDEDKSQFQRTRSFTDGLNQASEAFRERFKVIARGMSRPYWAESPEALAASNPPEDLELPMQKFDFRHAATNFEASRDTGAQLFCALLRSAGVEARLVCSLQPLPFTATVKTKTSQILTPKMAIANSDGRTALASDESDIDRKGKESREISNSIGSIGGRSRFSLGPPQRLGILNQSPRTESPNRTTLSSKKPRPKRIKESPYPIFWVEAFDVANQKWIPIDPLVTNTVSKPSKFEPPASDSQNNLTYVLAFEDDGSARDVTRRYAKAFNAKTRKGRVEVTNGGEKWWKRVLEIYKRSYVLARDQIEDSSLVSKEAAEPMPKNVLDFKDHPYYALERHLKRGEVIHPKREAGKVAVGRTGGQQILEPIFRRRDVHIVKSADSWYRMGREIKAGEQPLKRVPARRKKEPALDDDDPQSASEEIAGVPLYAADQTTLYRPPPVVNGRIPKNVYGNLDIYVSSMVPAGGSHITHPETARAARVLGIDYAQAVTGFEFRGRHGTAVISGAVVASEYLHAVKEVIEGFDDEKAQEEQLRSSVEALRAWKRLLVGLRIRERIEGYEIEGERKFADEVTGRINDKNDESDDEDEEEDDDDYGDDEGGGYVPQRMLKARAEPTARLIDRYREGDDEMGGGFLAETSLGDDERGFDSPNKHPPRGYDGEKDLQDYDQDAGGGFMIDDVSDENDQKQGIRPTIDRLGTGRIEDQCIDQLVQEARSPQNHPSGMGKLETSTLPVEGNLADDSIEQLTDWTEDSMLLSEGGSERDGGGFIPEDDFSTAAIHSAIAIEESKATLPVIPSVDPHHAATTLEEGEEHEVTGERGPTMRLTTTHSHREEEASDHPSGPVAAASSPAKPRNEQGSEKASTPIHLSKSSRKTPLSPSADERPSPSPDNDESMIASQPKITAAVQDHDNAPGATKEGGAGGGRWNDSSDDEDAESLLSQDPEDEDADPEWLA